MQYSAEEKLELEALCSRYKTCLDLAKTERECVRLSVAEAEKAGYRNLDEVIERQECLKPGDKVYRAWMDKTLVLFHLGQRPIEEGMRILGAHIDSPRLDLKQDPLFEEGGFAYLDTHYYGGIKKYQWVTIPLALHGVVVKKDGTKVEVVIGEKETDPVFVMTDLLIHLSSAQMNKKAGEVIVGEQLDLLFGNTELEDAPEDVKEKVKANVLRILLERLGIEEADFLSAELEVVPVGKARDCGIDSSMILGYGQDDRVCAFPSLFALLELEAPAQTACVILSDKEEVGSMGATGMSSRFFEDTVAELLACMQDVKGDASLALRRALSRSMMLSSDVSAAYDPKFPEVFNKKNAAYFGKGVVFCKYTGRGGKSGSSDANAEYVAYLRKIMEQGNVAYQTAELGKVDAGGGGTIAYILANYGMQVIDCGVAVLSMHAPYEVTCKADIYESMKCYRAFLGIS